MLNIKKQPFIKLFIVKAKQAKNHFNNFLMIPIASCPEIAPFISFITSPI
jgi:hypothetical protein